MTKLIIYGSTPTVYALANMGRFLNYNCYICSPNAVPQKIFQKKLILSMIIRLLQAMCAVVATQGENDIQALKSAIASNQILYL